MYREPEPTTESPVCDTATYCIRSIPKVTSRLFISLNGQEVVRSRRVAIDGHLTMFYSEFVVVFVQFLLLNDAVFVF